MNNLKKFLKDYWPWLLLGLVVGCIVGLLIWVFYTDKQQEMKIKETFKILNPYKMPKHSVQIVMDTNDVKFNSQEEVFKVSRPETQYLDRLTKAFVDMPRRIDSEEDFSMEYEDNIFSYTSDSAIFAFLSKPAGIKLDVPVNSVGDIVGFFDEYIGVKTVNNIQEIDSNGDIKYMGYIDIMGKSVGTPYLNGYGYILTINGQGNMVRFQILALEQSNIGDSLKLPTVEISDVLNMGSYPMMVFNIDMEERFYEQPPLIRGSAYLDSLSVKSMDMFYGFNGFLKSPYILPTFKLKGDGQMIDSQGSTYWSSSEIYVCGVDMEYLEEVEEEEIVIFDPAPLGESN